MYNEVKVRWTKLVISICKYSPGSVDFCPWNHIYSSEQGHLPKKKIYHRVEI